MKIIIAVVFFLGGIAVGHFFFPSNTRLYRSELRQPGKLTNPLLECELFNNNDQKEMHVLKTQLESYIDTKINEGAATHVSVYVRDLNDGPWIGIDEKVNFSPASLLKVPIMIAYLKAAEQNPAILSQKILYATPSALALQEITPKHDLKAGKTYTVEELIRTMIVNSSNEARGLLYNNIDPQFINQTFIDLQITVPDVRNPEDFMSVKDYAAFFRILYNASYLNLGMSEKALSLLSQIDFESGIVAGIPKNTTVANKFGEREFNTGIKQLHDCGIVYFSKSPYLICIMTRGTNLNTLSEIIAEISKKTYEYKSNL